ncbi:hypothetical protein TWF694_003505 [Orbilia ellipsospora]|uniref:Uncharacterized protein n=1 Tax=Orbilia ellipsospora TaxID=2528407 RepID=A0AAV9X0L4_9PEZI
MKTSTIFITALSVLPSLGAAQAAAGGGVLPQAPPPATTVWVTVTNAAGVVATVPSLYTQTFRSPPPMVAVKSGQIGLGQWAPGASPVTTGTQLAKRTALPSMNRYQR